jgi:lipopolysaccharide export system permease protein
VSKFRHAAGWNLRWLTSPLGLLDRYVLHCFFMGYVACFASFLALYIVIDLFTKLDEFAADAAGFSSFFANVISYYAFRLPWFFQRLSGIITMMAGIFTLAWMEHQNELLPWLSAGVPSRRLLYPILIAAACLILVGVLNREFVVPRCSTYLVLPADDPQGKKPVMVRGGYDSRLIHFEGGIADRQRQVVQDARITLPSDLVGGLMHLRCTEMHYRPARQGDDNGWYLLGVTAVRYDPRQPVLDYLGSGTYFLHTDMTFDRLTRSSTWFQYEPTAELIGCLNGSESVPRRSEVMATLHHRCTGPLLDLLLVLLGIGAILSGHMGRSIFLKIGTCLLLYGTFQGAQFACATLAHQAWLDPSLAAWLPILLFGPIMVVLWDGLKT